MSAKLIICIYAASIVASHIVKDETILDELYIYWDGGLYHIYNSLEYEEAKSTCREVDGGQLAQFETVWEKELLESFLRGSPDFKELGLGGRCGSDQGRYEWDDSTQILPSVWGENNSQPIEPCNANHRVGAKRVEEKLELYGFPSSELKHYVCEVKWF